MTLRWPCQENTTNVRCILIPWEKGPIMSRGGECSCTFMQESLHRGLTLEVQATVNQRPVQEKLLYTNPGADGTAVQNFSCSIYNAGFMNCTWVKGRAAPDDVQYFMYIKNKRTLLEMECPCYLQESGIHTGCHLSNLSLLSVKSYVLVNGSSPAMGIQFFDSIFLTKGIEKLDPPANVTVHCNVSHCHVRWHQPRTWHRFTHQDFQYQLDIQRQNIDPGNLNPLINISGNSENKYHFPSPEPRHKHTVQIRVADTRRPQWSAWSRPVEFGEGTKHRALGLGTQRASGDIRCMWDEGEGHGSWLWAPGFEGILPWGSSRSALVSPGTKMAVPAVGWWHFGGLAGLFPVTAKS
nr:granulocyte-macrophage colony-stimulating factor receptor subunit alpha-like isoform X2 [Castor canadensis]